MMFETELEDDEWVIKYFAHRPELWKALSAVDRFPRANLGYYTDKQSMMQRLIVMDLVRRVRPAPELPQGSIAHAITVRGKHILEDSRILRNAMAREERARARAEAKQQGKSKPHVRD